MVKTVLLLLAAFAASTLASNHDATMTPGATGSDVVERVGDLILGACLFDDDKLFSRRVAFVETGDGKNPTQNNYLGGIWKVDEAMFLKTKEAPSQITLSPFLTNIKKAFGIDWSKTTWQDCTKPLVSGLAARLYIQAQIEGTQTKIPREIDAQADFWATYYRNGGNKQLFIDGANNLYQDCKQIYGADLVFLLDGSGSVTKKNFNKMKTFVQDVVLTFDVGSNATRVAVGTFWAKSRTDIYLNTYFNRDAIVNKISRIAFPSGGTRTDLALNSLISTIFTTNRGARDPAKGIPRVAVILTDGKSNYPDKTVVSALKAHDADITMFAVGVGPDKDLFVPELQAIASEPECLHLMRLDNFQEIDSLKYAISKRTCDAPVIAGPGTDGTEIDGKLPSGGDQNCKLKVPDGGTTVKIGAMKGKATFYLASNTYPSASYYDVKVETVPKYPGVVFVPKPATQDAEGIVYCNIKGDETTDTDLEIDILPGDEDRCKGNPCKNGGKCVDEGASYRCECTTGFEGTNCDQPTDYCKNAPCKNGGICTSANGSYQCTCAAGFEGKDCGSTTDFCKTSPCKNGAACVSSVGGYVCTCTAGFTGANCDTPVVTDPCKPNPCVKGSCSPDANGKFFCTCQIGWQGTHCNEPTNKCSTSPCLHGNCTAVGTRYECCCEHGWTGRNCDTEIDECASNPCVHGECKDRDNGYVCDCKPGYIGHHCEIPIDECESNPCIHGDCQDKVNSYVCHCQHGWTGKNCDSGINECDSNPCAHGTCEDHVNYYKCICDSGWIGVNCEIDIDECSSSPCHQGTCVDGINRYDCTCPPGWTGTNCDKDIDECISNPCVHGDCLNGMNRYDCHCHPGYTGVNCETEINECASNPCMNGATCDDRINEYLCECAAGFTGTHCETDIDECASDPCQHGTCTDHVNHYTCKCTNGWTGTNCDCLVDNCESNPCTHGICRNSIGAFTCTCNAGFAGVNCDSPLAPASTRRPYTTPATAQPPPGTGYSCAGKNPCTTYNLSRGKYYHAHINPNKFVQCDEHGGCFEMPCPRGLIWDVRAYTCNRP